MLATTAPTAGHKRELLSEGEKERGGVVKEREREREIERSSEVGGGGG